MLSREATNTNVIVFSRTVALMVFFMATKQTNKQNKNIRCMDSIVIFVVIKKTQQHKNPKS
jgi:hypothetical protein